MCARCGDILDRPPTSSAGPEAPASLCRVCRLAAPPFVKAVAYGPYEGRMRDLIHALKYDGLRPAARGLGKLLADAILQLAPEAPAAIARCPSAAASHEACRARFQPGARPGCRGARGLAQAGTRLASDPGAQHPDPASRHGKSGRIDYAPAPPQHARSFPVYPIRSLVAGRHILLVDDIFTTGATARAASRALLEAGAESIYVATLARAHRIDRAFDRSLVASENTETSTALHAAVVNHRHATMNAQNQPSF